MKKIYVECVKKGSYLALAGMLSLSGISGVVQANAQTENTQTENHQTGNNQTGNNQTENTQTGNATISMGEIKNLEAETSVSDFTYEDFTDQKTGELGVVITSYKGTAENVVIPEKINGKNVLKLQGTFYNQTTLKRVIMPGNLYYIGEKTFSGCKSLTTMGYRVEIDGETKEKVTEGIVMLPDSLREIQGIKSDTDETGADGAFDYCTSITKVVIGKNLTSVGPKPFYECSSLERFEVNLDNSVLYNDSFGVLYQRYKGEDLSQYSGVAPDLNAETVHLVRWPMAAQLKEDDFQIHNGIYPMQKNLSMIDPYACHNVTFRGKGLKINGPCYVIGDHAFEKANHLAGNITFSADCKTVILGNRAFYGNEVIHELTLPATVTTIGAYCFAECTNLDTIHFQGPLKTLMEGAFYNCRTLHTIDVPEGVEAVENKTFSGCTNLDTVVLPDSLKKIGSEAFKDCRTIHEMVIPKNVEYVDNTSFSGMDLTKIDFSKNAAMAKKFGITVKTPVLKTKSFVLKPGKKGKIVLATYGFSVKNYSVTKASKNKISVNKNGTIQAKKKAKAGIANVRITMNDGRIYQVKVYVTKTATKKPNAKKTITLKPKKKVQLVYGQNPLAVKYSISKKDKKYASLNRYGIVTAKKKTKKAIVVTAKSGKTVIKQKIRIK